MLAAIMVGVSCQHVSSRCACAARADVWWFGLVFLARGPLLSLPAVIATDMPALTLTLMLCILQLAESWRNRGEGDSVHWA